MNLPKYDKSLRAEMDRLVIGIGHEIDAVIEETGNLGDDIAGSLCDRFADDWNLYDHNGEYPEWLRWVVVGVLNKKGITEL
jgi:hypothetical protein